MTFHESTKESVLSKQHNKAEFKDLDDPKFLRSDFSVLRTSAGLCRAQTQ